MAFSSVIRRAASRVVPLAIRASAGSTQRSLHHQTSSALFAATATNCSQRSFPLFSHQNFSTFSNSDASLLRVLESEIQDAIDSQADAQADEVPEGFPFKIEDHPGQQTITLHRELQGETITVEVYNPDISGGEQDEDEEQDGEGGSDSSNLPLVVKVSKKNGPSLEFGCTAFADEIAIDSLSVKDAKISDDLAYEGPDFLDLDENLQKAFHKYLEIRGIKPSTTNFLHEYMIEKDGKEYLTWLENIKKFIKA